jgi:hypothetical protein
MPPVARLACSALIDLADSNSMAISNAFKDRPGFGALGLR